LIVIPDQIFRDLELYCQQKIRTAADSVKKIYRSKGWLRGTAVERWSLAGKLSLSCARPIANG